MVYQSVQSGFNPAQRVRESVYAFQREGKMNDSFRKTASGFAKGAKVHLANPDIPRERQLIDHVIDGCQFRGIKHIPPVAIVDSHIVNAASVNGKGIFFTSGIMKAMPDEQIRAVVGHELSHHRHSWRDLPVLLGIDAAIAYAISFTNISFQTLLERGIKPAGKWTATAVAGAGLLLDTIAIGAILTPWRWYMELESDREGAQFAGAKHMGDSLETLKHKKEELKERRQLTPFQYVAGWVKRAIDFIISPFGSHPPVDFRISEMRRLEPNAHYQPSASTKAYLQTLHAAPDARIKADDAQHGERVAAEAAAQTHVS